MCMDIVTKVNDYGYQYHIAIPADMSRLGLYNEYYAVIILRIIGKEKN